MTRARTIWEEGHRPGRQLVVLGGAALLTVAVADLAIADAAVGPLFDVCFVLVCMALALAVRQRDFFTVGVLPPLLMLAVFVVLALTAPAGVAGADDNPVQAVVTALATHAGALAFGYAVCLLILAVRHRVLSRVGAPARPRAVVTPPSGRAPAPRADYRTGRPRALP